MKLLSTTQASEILGVNDSRIRQLIRDGQLQAVQVGRAYLLDEAVVRSFQRSPMGRPKKEGAAEDEQASPPAQTRTTRTPAQKKRIRDEQQRRWKGEQLTLPEVPVKKSPAGTVKAVKKGGKK